MGAHLSIAVKIAHTGKAIFRNTRPLTHLHVSELDAESNREHVGVEPMLLALSMELALKAWFVFDFDDPKHTRSHNLAQLFDELKAESRMRLDAEFKRSIAPYHPDILHIDYGIRHLLYQHKDAFIDWRYLHEPKSTMFDQAAFEATLEMVLTEFEKRYREVPIATAKT